MSNSIREVAKEVQVFALRMLQDHGLFDQGWTFNFNRRKRSFGLCSYRDKSIYISMHAIEHGEPAETLKQTVIHEVAHALAGPGTGHGPVWKAKARQLGLANPKACRSNNFTTEQKYNWYRRCGSCDFKVGYFRKPARKRRTSCPTCSGGRFNEKFVLEVIPAEP